MYYSVNPYDRDIEAGWVTDLGKVLWASLSIGKDIPKDKMGFTSHLGHTVLPAREFLNRALLTGEQARSVLKLNDEDGWSFTAIAQWIRENLS
jgi:hypothetical protein